MSLDIDQVHKVTGWQIDHPRITVTLGKSDVSLPHQSQAPGYYHSSETQRYNVQIMEHADFYVYNTNIDSVRVIYYINYSTIVPFRCTNTVIMIINSITEHIEAIATAARS